MSESKRALQPAQPVFEQAANEAIQQPDLELLTELELMLAGGGESVDPWPK